MVTVYEGTKVYAPTATSGYRQEEKEFSSMAEAKAYVDEIGSGKVITWIVTDNLPGRFPAKRYNSCALTVCNDGIWKDIDIHERSY